jgi:hypothetical protein
MTARLSSDMPLVPTPSTYSAEAAAPFGTLLTVTLGATSVVDRAHSPEARALAETNRRRPLQPRWPIRFKITASRLYGPAPAEMININMKAYKVSGR